MKADSWFAWRRLLIRSLFSAPFFGFGFFLWVSQGGNNMLGAFAGVLIGAGFILIGAILIASPLAELISSPMGSIYYSEARDSRPPPQYSIAESKVKQGKFQEAMEMYQKIALEYPKEVKPYIDMIEIAVLALGDIDLAEEIYNTGMETLKKKESRQVLTRMYVGTRTRIDYARPEEATSRIKPPQPRD